MVYAGPAKDSLVWVLGSRSRDLGFWAQGCRV